MPCTPNFLGQSIERIEHAGARACDGRGRILYGFADTVPSGIQDKLSAIAKAILDGNQAMRVVVLGEKRAAVRQERPYHVADAIVRETGYRNTDIAAGESAARIVNECRDETVCIYQGEWVAVWVIGRDPAYVSQGVSGLDDVTLCIVVNRGDVGNIVPGTVMCRNETRGVLSIRCSS